MLDDLIKGVQDADRLLPTTKVAAMLGIKPHTLNVWLCKKKNGEPAPDLPYVKVGRRAIRYRLSDVQRFIDLNRHTTGEVAQ